MAGKDRSSNKEVQTKGEKGAKGKQVKASTSEMKEYSPAENREATNEGSPASDEAAEKEAKSE